MNEPFRFPQAGELRNPEGIPMSVPDVYRLLLAAAPILITGGESVNSEDPLNGPLLAWWNAMNALPRPLAITLQALIRDMWGELPPAPWEDVDPNGEGVTARVMTWDELATWAQAQDDAE